MINEAIETDGDTSFLCRNAEYGKMKEQICEQVGNVERFS